MSNSQINIYSDQPGTATGKLLRVASRPQFRVALIIACFIGLILMRQLVESFSVSLGYLYILLISLSAFWFGIKGGLAAAAVSSCIFIAEVYALPLWPAREAVFRGMFLRLAVYFLEGVIIGSLSGVEKRLAVEKGQKEQLEQLAHYDELTGCVNFRWIMHKLEEEISRSKRYHKKMTIVMMDIDHFKAINDIYGHLVGNDCLKIFARTIQDNMRNNDVVGRYGGDEFLIILPEAGSHNAVVGLERLKGKLSQRTIDSNHYSGQHPLRIKFSAGIASFPTNGENTEEIVSAADNALYHAKKGGRSRTVIERRRWLRLKPLANVNIEMADGVSREKITPLEIINISQRGILLLLPNKLSDNELLCRIIFPSGDQTAWFNCMVRHQSRDTGIDHRYKAGILFQGDIENIGVRSCISTFKKQPR